MSKILVKLWLCYFLKYLFLFIQTVTLSNISLRPWAVIKHPLFLNPKKVILSPETDRAKQSTENGDKHGCYCLSWSHCKNTGTDPNIYVMKDGASARIPPLPFKITWIGSRSGPVGIELTLNLKWAKYFPILAYV